MTTRLGLLLTAAAALTIAGCARQSEANNEQAAAPVEAVVAHNEIAELPVADAPNGQARALDPVRVAAVGDAFGRALTAFATYTYCPGVEQSADFQQLRGRLQRATQTASDSGLRPEIEQARARHVERMARTRPGFCPDGPMRGHDNARMAVDELTDAVARLHRS